MKISSYVLPLALALVGGRPGAQNGAHDPPTQRPITLEEAQRVANAAADYARQNGAGGAIAVVDDGGNLVHLIRLDGTFAAGSNVSIGKARTAALFRKETGFFEKIINEGRTAMSTLTDFTPLQGGVPILVDGTLLGAIGVSGAKSAQQDEEVARVGAAVLSQAPVAAVRFFGGQAVSAAFQKGAPLFEGEAYKVHASRRDGPGEAEVHERDTDIVYVLEGTADIVLGGSVVDARRTGPEEIRGKALEGGECRPLAKGDVLVVPAGTPHWFSKVPGPFTYYVVKAR